MFSVTTENLRRCVLPAYLLMSLLVDLNFSKPTTVPEHLW